MLKKGPRALIITAGTCGFRFENEAYGLRMAAQGVTVTMKRFCEARHGFIPHFGHCWEAAAEAMVKIIRQPLA
jgi:acetyl esterase/lipase